MRYLLIQDGQSEIVESEPSEVWTILTDLKYPEHFISLTALPPEKSESE